MYMDKFVKERDDALLSLDKKKILAYSRKYGVQFSKNEKVFWAGVHKAITAMTSATEEQKQRSRDWLVANGFKPYIS